MCALPRPISGRKSTDRSAALSFVAPARLYQLVVSAPLLGLGAIVFSERITALPSAVALGAFAYQTIYVVSITLTIWFALVVRYSAARIGLHLSGTAFWGGGGSPCVGEPLTPAFAVAVALVAAGLLLVNRPQ